MNRMSIAAVLALSSFAMNQARVSAAAQAPASPASQPTTRPTQPPIGPAVDSPATTKPTQIATTSPARMTKYDVPTAEEVLQSQATISSIFDRAKKDINPNLHRIETAHFTIFSGLPTAVDTGIGQTMERMYQALRKQFEVGKDESVWIGKCGIFLLSAKPDNQFFDFATKIDNFNPNRASKAGAYIHCASTHAYVVMPPPPDERKAREMEYWKCTLIHESTHAFLFRYLGNARVPLWLNEGIAETIACQIMGSRILEGHMRQANKQAMLPKNFADVTQVFNNVGLTQFDYGIAQSWVRFLASTNPKAFLRFVTLCKQGMDDEVAMKEAFKLSRPDFLKVWGMWAKNTQ